MGALLEIRSLTKHFGNLTAVSGVTFHVSPGEVLGFLGPNGAGKSTTMKMVTGFLHAELGRGPGLRLRRVRRAGAGQDAPRVPARRRAGLSRHDARRRSCASSPRSAACRRAARGRRIEEVVRQVHLEGVLHQPIETLSKGYKRRVGLAQAILHDPQVLIMDEPTDGLDPNQKHEVRKLIRAHGAEQGHRALHAHPRGGRGGLHARDHHQPRPHRVRRHADELLARRPPNVTKNRLDWVFRSLTTSETGPPEEAAARERQGGRQGMKRVLCIAKRELRGYFGTPVAYVFIVIFLLLSGVFTFQLGRLYRDRPGRPAPFFAFHPWLYLFLIPAISMRLWAEERQPGTIELLMTLPSRMGEAVLGKFLAAWAFTGIALVLTFPIWLTVNYLGDPDNGVILAG